MNVVVIRCNETHMAMGVGAWPAVTKRRAGTVVVTLATAGGMLGCQGQAGSPSTSRAHQALGEFGEPLLSAELEWVEPRLRERASSCPAAAFNGSVHAVTHGQYLSYWPEQTYEIALTRFDRDGNALDPFGIKIATAYDWCSTVVATGATFLVTWRGRDDTHCARVAEDGTVLDLGGISTGTTVLGVVGAATDGSQVLVTTGTGMVALLGADCRAVQVASLPLTPKIDLFIPGGVAFDGTQYWVTYTERRVSYPDRFFAASVSTSGVVTGLRIVATAEWPMHGPTDERMVAQGSVASGNGTTAIGYSWLPVDRSYEGEIRYAELTNNGIVGDQTLVSDLSSPFQGTTIGFAGDGFVVAGGYPSVLAKRRSDGSTFARTLSDFDFTRSVSFSHDGSSLLVAGQVGIWDYARPYWTTGQLLDADLEPLAPSSPLQWQADTYEQVAAALGGDTFLAVWKETLLAPTPPGFFAARVTRDGTALDSAPLSLGLADSAEAPAVASNGTDFLVTWGKGGGGVTFATVSQEGVVRPGEPLSDAVTAPRAASNGSDYLLVWTNKFQGAEPTLEWHLRVEAARIDGQGNVLQERVVREGVFDADREPKGLVAVSYDGSSYIVASGFSQAPELAPIVLQRVSSSGEVSVANGTGWHGDLQQVTTGACHDSLVTFIDGTNVYAGRVNDNLQHIDRNPLLVTTSASSETADNRTSLAWDGSTYWVSWKDQRAAPGRDEVYAARVATNGELLDPDGIVVSSGVSDALLPFGRGGGVLVSDAGRVLAVYSRFDVARERFSWLPRGRWLSNELGLAGAGGADSCGDGVTGGGTSGAGGREDETGPGGGSTSRGGSMSHGGSTSHGGSGGSSGDAGSSDGGGEPGEGGRDTSGGGRSGAARGGGGSEVRPEGGRADSPAAPSPTPSSSGAPDAGCGCRAAGSFHGTRWSTLIALGLILPVARRRRRRAAPPWRA